MWSANKREGEGFLYSGGKGWHLTKWSKGTLMEDMGPVVDTEETKVVTAQQ